MSIQLTDGVLLCLVADVGGEGHHGLHHVLPVVRQPLDGVPLPTVVHSNLTNIKIYHSGSQQLYNN